MTRIFNTVLPMPRRPRKTIGCVGSPHSVKPNAHRTALTSSSRPIRTDGPRLPAVPKELSSVLTGRPSSLGAFRAYQTVAAGTRMAA